MPKFLKKQFPVEARKLHFSNPEEIADIAKWCKGTVTTWMDDRVIEFRRDTGRRQVASDGDWILKDEDGSFDTIEEALLLSLFDQVK